MMDPKTGIESGEKCNRDGCNGIIESHSEGGCSCHIVAPCSSCTSGVYCPECDWDSDEDYVPPIPSKITLISAPEPIEDDGNLYRVGKYFDNHFEYWVSEPMTIGEANRVRQDKQNIAWRNQKLYTTYNVKKVK